MDENNVPTPVTPEEEKTVVPEEEVAAAPEAPEEAAPTKSVGEEAPQA